MRTYSSTKIIARAIVKSLNETKREKKSSNYHQEQHNLNSKRVSKLFSAVAEKTTKNTKISISRNNQGGHEFEQLIAAALRALDFNNVKVTSYGADGGVDISCTNETKLGTTVKFFIECKHQPTTTIGRPIVQKLDSAVKDGKADKGMIITSGTFSPEAIEYARRVGIDLIDGNKLKNILQQTGTYLELNIAPSEATPITEWTEIERKVTKYFEEKNIVNLKTIELKPIQIKLRPIYAITYTINSTFSASIGVIHSIFEKTTLMLELSGNEVDAELVSTIIERSENLSNTPSHAPVPVLQPEMIIPLSKLDEPVKELLINKYTTTVSYEANNGVKYPKVCSPSKKDIQIENIKQYLIPEWEINVKLNGTPYLLELMDLLGKCQVLNDSSEKCSLCPKEETVAICSNCANIICPQDAKQCKNCEKSLCKNCTKWQKKWMILADSYCEHCFKEIKK